MVLRAGFRQGVGMRRVHGTVAGCAIAAALIFALLCSPAAAQGTLNDALAAKTRQAGQEKDRLLVEADELVYNDDKNTVSAVGNAELYYQGRTLQAHRVIYDRSTGRVFAEGNARLTDAAGTLTTGERFELTDDFKSGFIDSLRVVQSSKDRSGPIKTYFGAPRAERVEGETTVFNHGTYTACEPCREHPERPPLWQVKAARIIHNNSERTVYYENAWLEFAGVPIAYVPYFWSPDPTVRRQTGFLAPHYIVSSALGTGVALPFFWNIAPDYDLTLQPTYYSRQGFLAQAEWRQRFSNGFYNIRAAGIEQQDETAFLAAPVGPRDRERRGSLESAGRFEINERWRFGWDVALVSDKWFLQNYRIRSESFSTNYLLRESTSTAYLQGRGDRSWFDLRAFYFQSLSYADWQKQLPVVAPSLDYDKRVNGPEPIAGEVRFNANLTSLTRELSQFQGIGTNKADLFPGTSYAGYYPTCQVFLRGQCILLGAAGSFTRLSSNVSWRRDFVDTIGQVWTPFTYLRADGFFNAPRTAGLQNDQLSNFFDTEARFVGRVTPAVGMEYRYPFVADAGRWGIHTLEPIAQIVARPNEGRIHSVPNEDSHSLILDDTTLFDWDKFSGYDRAEGGVRANYGAQYTITTPGGFYFNALFGQSYQLAGRNSYAGGDLLNSGIDTGLDTRRSDYVARLQLNPDANYGFIMRSRFDKEDFSPRSFETTAMARLKPLIPLTASLTYAHYESQPALGYTHRREGLSSSASFELSPNWTVTGSVLFDLDKYLDYRETFATSYAAWAANPSGSAPVYRRPDVWSPTGTGVSIGYKDECTTLTINYSMTPRVLGGEKESDKTVLVRLELRSLGQAGITQNLSGTASTGDGLAAP
jgi:LPS-assembly protein